MSDAQPDNVPDDRLPVPFYAPPDRPLWTHAEVDAYYADCIAAQQSFTPYVGQTLIRCEEYPPVIVSTLFRMLSASVFWGGPPILWETIVINGPTDRTVTRYMSPEDATAGHRTVVLETLAALRKADIPVTDMELKRGEWWVE